MSRYHYKLPANEHEFQDFCLRLYRLAWKREMLVQYTKRGERQHGIDLIDQLAIKPWVAIQCKQREPNKTITPAEINSEVTQAEHCDHAIDQYIIATTAKKTKRAQDAVMKLNKRPDSKRKLTVVIHFWEEICTLLDEMDPATAEFILTGQRASDETTIASIVTQQSSLSASATQEPDGNELYPEINKLFKERRIDVAEHEIKKLPDPEHTPKLPNSQKYALFRLHGKLSLEKLDFDSAARFFLLAYKAQPRLEQAKHNRILALELLGKRREAYREAAKLLKMGGAGCGIATLLIRNSRQLEEITKHEPQINQFIDEEEINTSLADRYRTFGAVDKAVEAANRAIKISPDSAHAHMAVAMMSHHLSAQGDCKQRKANIESALNHYTNALKLARRDNYNGLLPVLLSNRARINAFAGDDEAAAADYLEAIKVADRPDLYAPDAIAFFLSKADFNSANNLLGMMKGATDEVKFLQLITKIGLVPTKEKPRIIRAMARLASTRSDRSIEARFHCVQWSVDLHDLSLARSCVPRKFVKSHPFHGNTLLAWMSLEAKERDRARKYAETAFNTNSSAAHKQELAVLARIFARLDDDEKALQLWERAITPGVIDDNCKSLLSCAQRLKRHDTLLRICAELRETGAFDDATRKLEVHLLSQYLPKEALKLAKEFRKYDERYFTAASNCIAARLDYSHEIDLDKSRLPSPDQIDPEDSHLVVIPYLAMKRFDEAIQFAYEQLRLNFDNEHAHGRYFWLIVYYGTQSTICEASAIVDAKSAVLLKNMASAKLRWITIEDNHPQVVRNEFPLKSPIAAIVFGKRTGDTIDVPGELIQPQQETIVEIQSKYVRAFQDSIENFQNRFPGVDAIQSMNLGSDDNLNPAPLIETLKRRREYVNEITDFYQSNLCSIYFLASRLGTNEVQMIRGLSSEEKWLLRCVECAPQEFDSLGQKGIESKQIVLDITAVVALSRLDAWASLDASKDYIVSQTTLDALSEWIDDLVRESSQQTGTSFVTDDDRLVILDAAPEEIEARKKELEDMRALIKKTCVVKSSVAVSGLEPQKRELYIKAVGFHTLEAISLAKDEGAPLWTDDLFVAHLATVEFGITRVWTQRVLKDFLQRKLISDAVFDSATAKLAAWNYVNTIWEAKTMICAGELNNWDTDSWPLKHCIKLIGETPISQQDRGILLLNILKLLRSSACGVLRQSAVVQACLDSVGDGRVVQWALKNIGNFFGLDLPAASFFRPELQYWLRHKFIS